MANLAIENLDGKIFEFGCKVMTQSLQGAANFVQCAGKCLHVLLTFQFSSCACFWGGTCRAGVGGVQGNSLKLLSCCCFSVMQVTSAQGDFRYSFQFWKSSRDICWCWGFVIDKPKHE